MFHYYQKSRDIIRKNKILAQGSHSVLIKKFEVKLTGQRGLLQRTRCNIGPSTAVAVHYKAQFNFTYFQDFYSYLGEGYLKKNAPRSYFEKKQLRKVGEKTFYRNQLCLFFQILRQEFSTRAKAKLHGARAATRHCSRL